MACHTLTNPRVSSPSATGPEWRRAFSGAKRIEAQYPMMVMRLADVLAITAQDGVPPHQVALKRGLLHAYTPGDGAVLFVSHQWLGDEHPDPSFIQFDVLQSALRLLAAGETDVHSHPQLVVTGGSIKMLGAEFQALLTPPNVYVWLDYFSVPQPTVTRDRATLAHTRAAIMSIPYYVREATHVLILAPGAARAAADGGLCDYWTWMKRGWCRLECVAHALGSRDASAKPPLLVQQARDICFCSPFDYLTRPVGRGTYTVPSDRAVVAPVLWSILASRLASRLAAGDLDGYRWARAMRSHLMSGVPIGSAPEHAAELLHDDERTWAEFKAAYRFDGPHDDSGGYTPLRYAVMANNVRVAEELLALGADVHARTPARGSAALGSTGGDSVLATAMQTCGGHFDAAPMLELLLRYDAQVNFHSRTTGNGLLVEAAVWGNCDTMRALLALYPPARAPRLCEAAGPIFNTPALACALIGQEEPARELARAGVSFRAANFLGWQALHHASHWGWSGMVELLLQTDARIDIDELVVPPLTVRGWPNALGASVIFRSAFGTDDGPKQAMVLRCLGGTPLHCAVTGDQWMCAHILLRAGADPSARSLEGLTPLELALALGERADLVELLSDAIEARRSGRPSVVLSVPTSLAQKAEQALATARAASRGPSRYRALERRGSSLLSTSFNARMIGASGP